MNHFRIILFIAVLVVSISAAAEDASSRVTVTKQLDGTTVATGGGTVGVSVSGANVQLTVTPDNGNYFETADLTVRKYIDAGHAQTRGFAGPVTPGYDETVTVTAGSGNTLTGTSTFTFAIDDDANILYDVTTNFHTQTSIATATVTVNGGPWTYSGTAYEPDVTVTLGSATLSTTDYEVAYTNNVNAGEGEITVTGIGKYTGTNATGAFTIGPKSIAGTTVTLTPESLTFNRGNQKPTVTVSDGSTPLVLNTDYTLTNNGGTNVGEYSVTVTGKGNYDSSTSVTKKYNIVAKTITPVVTLANPAETFTYDGTAKEPALIVKDADFELSATDYDVAYSNNVNASEAAKATVTLKGNYTGSKVFNFTIAKAKLTVKAEDKSVKYGGEAPEYSVTYDGFVNNETASVLGGTLAFACDYKQGDDAGTYPITPSGLTSDNYEISFVSGTLTVGQSDMSVTAPKAVNGLVYTGKAQALITAGSADGGEMQYSLDGNNYDKAIPTGTDAKDYTVYYTVVADGNHKVVEPKTVSVTIAKAKLTVKAEDKSVKYGGEAPEFTVMYDGFVNNETASVLGGTLAFACDYKQGDDAGTYPITPSGLTSDNYEISFVSGTLTVEKQDEPGEAGLSFSGTSGRIVVVIGHPFNAPKLINPNNLTIIYSSSNEKAATVDAQGNVTITGVGEAVIKAIFEGNQSFKAAEASYTLIVVKDINTGLAFLIESVKATMGEPFEAPMLSNPYGLTVEYLSKDPAVATIDENGYVTLTGPGETEIWAIFKGNDTFESVAAMYVLSVIRKSETGLGFLIKEISATLGEDFEAPTLVNPFDLTVEYLSKNPAVATIDENGHVTLTGPGETEIWAIFKGNETFESVAAMYVLMVNEKPDEPIDPPTGISSQSVTADSVSNSWFSLNGQRMDKPTRKGLYILNRKKVVIK